jgi:hypothetical protein
MSALAATAVGVLAVACVALAVVARRTHRRLRAVEDRLARLETDLDTVDRTSRRAVETARAAETLARRPAGTPDPEPPRVVLEPLTGRLVKAVAFGAGARRAVTRLARGPRGTRP